MIWCVFDYLPSVYICSLAGTVVFFWLIHLTSWVLGDLRHICRLYIFSLAGTVVFWQIHLTLSVVGDLRRICRLFSGWDCIGNVLTRGNNYACMGAPPKATHIQWYIYVVWLRPVEGDELVVVLEPAWSASVSKLWSEPSPKLSFYGRSRSQYFLSRYISYLMTK